MSSKKDNFSTRLLDWHSQQHRPMPWKGERNPYLIWLSEIILQQTRVEQGLPYYERFKAAYPKVEDLAAAPEDEVLKLWEGLGYYSRARNLHFTAKYIARELEGEFPTTYDNILKLKGVGAYTAAAIASFAYDLPYAVLDGNVYRILARYFGIETASDSTAGKKEFAALAQALLDVSQAAKYNQAIMDFGALQCTPKSPTCTACPFQEDCTAFQTKSIEKYPVKTKKLKKRTRYFNYLLLNTTEQIIIEKRQQKDIWKGLYQFPLIETSALATVAQLQLDEVWQQYVGNSNYQLIRQSKPFKQTLSHQYIIATFWEIQLSQLPSVQDNTLLLARQDLYNYAFPKVIDWYLKDNSLYLNLI